MNPYDKVHEFDNVRIDGKIYQIACAKKEGKNYIITKTNKL